MNTDFFNDPVALATLVLACVTVVLAIGTFLTIRQNRIFREKDRKERLLNEIIEWAIDVYKCGVLSNSNKLIDFACMYLSRTERTKEDLDAGMRLIEISDLGDLSSSFYALKGKSKYMVAISTIFGRNLNLYTDINILVSNVENHIDIINKHHKEFSFDPEKLKLDGSTTTDEIHNHKQLLNLSAEKVIQEATKIQSELLK